MKGKIIGGGVLLLGVLGIGLHANVLRVPGIVNQVGTVAIANFSDDAELVGAAHNVFVGKVIKKQDSFVEGRLAFTPYEVVVLSNIKGDLEGTVTVLQNGGYKDGFLQILHDSESPDGRLPFPEVNQLYLFSSRHNVEADVHYLLPTIHAMEKVSSNTEFGAQADIAAITKSVRIEELREAYKNEVVPLADREHGSDFNSYNKTVPQKIE